jgi:endonuclease/exonuclease/phosphatase family metal-dependent hydrolase
VQVQLPSMTPRDHASNAPETGLPPAAPITLISFNVRYGHAEDGPNSWPFRREWVPAYLRELDADILGLQEAYDDQVRAVHAGLPGYGRVGVGRDDGVCAGEHCVIFYRADRFAVVAEGTFWFSDTPELAGSRTWGNSLPRICTWACLADGHTGRSLRVCNLHLDHAVQPARLRSVHLLAERIAAWHDSAPVIVMGDFNAEEDDPVVTHLQERGSHALVDTFRVVHPDAAAICTYHGFRGGEIGSKIDYILASRDVTVLDAAIIRSTRGGRYPSDHYPVTAQLRLDR